MPRVRANDAGDIEEPVGASPRNRAAPPEIRFVFLVSLNTLGTSPRLAAARAVWYGDRDGGDFRRAQAERVAPPNWHMAFRGAIQHCDG